MSQERKLVLKLADAVGDVWEEHLGHTAGDLWIELSDDDLVEISNYLFGHYQDAVTEWSRRQMVGQV